MSNRSPNTKANGKKTQKPKKVVEEESVEEVVEQRTAETSDRKKRRGQKTFNTEIYNLFKDVNDKAHGNRFGMTGGSRQVLSNITEHLAFLICERVVQLRSGSSTKNVNHEVTHEKGQQKGQTTTVTVRKNSSVLTPRLIKCAIMSLFPIAYFSKIDKDASGRVAAYKNSFDNEGRFSFNARTGLFFTSAHIGKILRKNVSFEKVSGQAIVYTTAAVEFVVRNIINRSLKAFAALFPDQERHRITSAIIGKTVAHTLNLRMVFRNCVFGQGVVPNHQKESLVKIGVAPARILALFPVPKEKKAAKSPRSPKKAVKKSAKKPAKKSVKKPAKKANSPKKAVPKKRTAKTAAKKREIGRASCRERV